ncbi:MAG: dNTP triphosphohydrolase [Muribaculaceae bacterium]|nr:dNTP triphosphohydrolase [Muribaculaceae bacterium]
MLDFIKNIKVEFDDFQIKGLWKQYELLRQPLMSEREHKETDSTQRNCFQRDYARVLYSSSFRRLQGKMQVLGTKSSAFYRNRLTHSLEVGQIALSIAKTLSDICEERIIEIEATLIGDNALKIEKTESPHRMYDDDLMVIQAAALAHDIGHPAFGHKGERVLNEIAMPFDMRFEGNAQNFRILRSLEKKNEDYEGLNLTYRTLLAINKYVNRESMDPRNKKFMYLEDYDTLEEKVRQKGGEDKLGEERTLDVQIIELADDIAYAVHDLEDGLKLRKFSIDDLLFLLGKQTPNTPEDRNVMRNFEKIVNDSLTNTSSNVDNIEVQFKLFTNKLTSQLTHWFVNSLDYRDVEVLGRTNPELTLKPDVYRFLDRLKKTVFESNTRDNEIHIYETRGEIVLKSLFLAYNDININMNGKLMPANFRPKIIIDKNTQEKDPLKYARYRAQMLKNSINYIAGMMDAYAMEEYERLYNINFHDIDISRINVVNESHTQMTNDLLKDFSVFDSKEEIRRA